MRFRRRRRDEVRIVQTAQLTEALKGLAAEIRRQNAVHATGEKAALDMLSGVMSGRIGANINRPPETS